MASSSEKTYWQLISESKARAATSLRKYREQMKIELDKYESHLKDIDSSLERLDSTSYFIRGKFGTSLNNACEDIKGQSSDVKKYTDTSLSPAMDDVCRIRSDEETISLLEQGKLVEYESVGISKNEVLEKLRRMVQANNPNMDASKMTLSDVNFSSDGTVSYNGIVLHDERLSTEAYRSRMTGFVTSDISALKAEIAKLKLEVKDYGSRPIMRYDGGYHIGIGTPISTAKYAPAPPTSLQVVTAVAKYAPAPFITCEAAKYAPAPIMNSTQNITCEAAKYAPAPATVTGNISVAAAKYAPAPAITCEAAKYAPAPATVTGNISVAAAKYAPAPAITCEAAKYAPAPATVTGNLSVEAAKYAPAPATTGTISVEAAKYAPAPAPTYNHLTQYQGSIYRDTYTVDGKNYSVLIDQKTGRMAMGSDGEGWKVYEVTGKGDQISVFDSGAMSVDSMASTLSTIDMSGSSSVSVDKLSTDQAIQGHKYVIMLGDQPVIVGSVGDSSKYLGVNANGFHMAANDLTNKM